MGYDDHFREIGQRLLDDIALDLDRSNGIPNLEFHVTVEPGRYWFFNPALANLRWRWLELEAQVQSLYKMLIQAWSLYIHEHTLTRLSEKTLTDTQQASKDLTQYCASIKIERNELLHRCSQESFTLRELLAWLAYDLLRGRGRDIGFLRPADVSYHTVRRAICNASSDQAVAEDLRDVREALVRLSDETAREFFELRNRSIHRHRLRGDEETPPLFVEVEKDRWDSIPIGVLSSRRILHLANEVWYRCLSCVECLGRHHPQEVPFRPRMVTRVDWRAAPDAIHRGVRADTSYGELFIRCSNNCVGYVGELRLSGTIKRSDEGQLRRVADIIADAMLEAVPTWESERTGGSFHYFLDKDEVPPERWIVYLKRDKERPRTVIEQGSSDTERDLQKMEIEGVEPRFVPIDEGVDQSAQTRNWSHAARAALKEFMKTGASADSVVKELVEGGNTISWYVVAKARIEALDNLGEGLGKLGGERAHQIVLFGYSEPVPERDERSS